jgi:hypothetical protein
MLNPRLVALGLVCGLLMPGWAPAPPQSAKQFRPPAVPLVTCDPYFSIWSFADRLTYDSTRHWTGARHDLQSMVRIDGKAYRVMGVDPRDVPALPQVGLTVLPSRTIYEFAGEGVHVTLTFMTPLLPHNLDVFSRPVTYLTWEVGARDGKEHAVSLYYDHSAELVVNTPDQEVVWSREKFGDLIALRMGSQQQRILGESGDDRRIDWGYIYAATPDDPSARQVIAESSVARDSFIRNGSLPETDDPRMPRPARDHWPAMAFAFDLGKVGGKPAARHLILAYDDLYSVEYMRRRLRPYWRRNGAEARDLLQAAAHDYESLKAQCQAFDRELMADLARMGGEKYARLAALAYRQSLAANKLAADEKGAPLFFPKENFSGGCVSTIDVIYPESPLLLLLNPRLLEASLAPVLDYALSGHWPFPFAPHDLGTYPLANGQVYGGGEKSEEDQMPVEESGNMLLMIGAITKAEGNTAFAARYWPLLDKWARYLKDKGLDPENQLCTDDFAGQLAHNANLALKAILALDAYAQLCELTGRSEENGLYHGTAREFARQWMKRADDGDHYRLAFDKPGTWSQKYNLVWNEALGLRLFPSEVARKEVAFYLRHLNPFGLPLDNRRAYTKLDWEIWTASLAQSPADFAALVTPAYAFADQSPNRVPLGDWYWTTDGTHIAMQARPVVGGVFIKMLTDSSLWKKWSSRAK